MARCSRALLRRLEVAALAVINPLQVRHDPLLCPRGGWNPPPGIPSSLGELTVGISSAMALRSSSVVSMMVCIVE
jgi:hypothetical protein